MSYPTLQQYQEALQHPRTAFADHQLQNGVIRTSGLGMPTVVSGGFALTYAVEVGSVRKAVRCFHRQTQDLERRYSAISAKLKQLAAPYFVDFEYQASGVRVDGQAYPLIKMQWASGETLGEFVESNYANKSRLTNLIDSLTELSAYLEQQGIAHGDLQEGNLMVAEEGRRIKLIDYDGMFVPEIAALGSSEMGHRDYQHPSRTASHFDSTLDRFSFITLNLALRALLADASIWKKSSSGAGVIVFRANDFSDPGSSQVLPLIERLPALATDAKHFATVCRSEFKHVPNLADFIAGKNIPSEIFVPRSKESVAAIPSGYISQYPVLDAASYSNFFQHIGQMVELVGRIVEVKRGVGAFGRAKGKPYIFVNFAPWQGQCVKINLWSDALAKGGIEPTDAWIGQWVTIKGLVEPVYRSPKYKYEHIAITAASLSQIVQLNDAEALYRLKGPRRGQAEVASNSERFVRMTGAGVSTGGRTPKASASTLSTNQQILERMRQQAASAGNPAPSSNTSLQNKSAAWQAQHSQINPPPKSEWRVPWWVWLLGIVILWMMFKK
jgi:hypothetical protein